MTDTPDERPAARLLDADQAQSAPERAQTMSMAAVRQLIEQWTEAPSRDAAFHAHRIADVIEAQPALRYVSSIVEPIISHAMRHPAVPDCRLVLATMIEHNITSQIRVAANAAARLVGRETAAMDRPALADILVPLMKVVAVRVAYAPHAAEVADANPGIQSLQDLRTNLSAAGSIGQYAPTPAQTAHARLKGFKPAGH